MDAFRYWRNVLAITRNETLSHFRRKVLLGSYMAIVAAALQFALHVRALSDTWKIIISLAGSAATVMIGSFFKHLLLTPFMLSRKSAVEIEELKSIVKPDASPVPPHKHREQRVLEWIGQMSAQQRDFHGWLLDHGEAEESVVSQRSRGNDVIGQSFERGLILTRREMRGPFGFTMVYINPDYKDALYTAIHAGAPRG